MVEMALEKLLITGASGVIGKVLVPKLAESYDVYSVDQNITAVPGRLFKADLSDYEQIASVLNAISDLRIIVHLAANSTADATWQSVLGTYSKRLKKGVSKELYSRVRTM
jgi:nucleoside-diphosphate-sugar epimerase